MATYPLVIHKETDEAVRAGRKYLVYTLTAGVLLIAATALTWQTAGRLEFVRSHLLMKADALTVVPLSNQASGAVTSMAWSDALAIVPAESTSLAEGDTVEVLRVS
ncbi:MAG: hypothetical protein MUQ00_05910, partial [Candidatus Aminicenantes bacterium]|nr:hypothetical protein [Candidatus Aminicenantes bacterium]